MAVLVTVLGEIHIMIMEQVEQEEQLEAALEALAEEQQAAVVEMEQAQEQAVAQAVAVVEKASAALEVLEQQDKLFYIKKDN